MNGKVTEYKTPKWFKIIAISYISIGFVFFLLFLGLILFSGSDETGEPVVELEPNSVLEWVFGISSSLVLGFTVVGFPAMILVHYGLKNQWKPVKYILFAAAAAWAIYITIQMLLG